MRAFAPLLLALTGCTVVDAPEDLEALLVFGFANFMGPEEFPVAATEGLRPMILDNAEELLEGYRINDLTREDIASSGITPDEEISIMGAAVSVQMRSSVDDLAMALTWPDMTEVQDYMIVWDVKEQGDLECFLAHACETYFLKAFRTRTAGILGEVSQTFEKHWRWVQLEDQVALTQQELVPEPAEIGWNIVSVDQQYAYSVFYDDGEMTRRVEAHWVDAEVFNLDIPDSFALDNTVNAIHDNAEQLDLFIESLEE